MTTWGQYVDSITAHMALYQTTARRLAAAAELQPGMAVVDLACGTGLTAMAALKEVPDGLRLTLVDSDTSVLEQAKRNLGEQAAAYHAVPPEQLASVVDGKVDRVLCNLGFFGFRQPEAVLEQARQVLKPTGRLCFTLSGTYFNTGGGVVSPQWAYLRLLHQCGLIQRPVNEVERLPNQRSIEGNLQQARLKPFHYEMFEVPEANDGEELRNLLRLQPVIEGDTFREAVDRSLAALAELAEPMAAMSPRWRAVLFMAQPQISPEEALMLRFGPK